MRCCCSDLSNVQPIDCASGPRDQVDTLGVVRELMQCGTPEAEDLPPPNRAHYKRRSAPTYMSNEDLLMMLLT